MTWDKEAFGILGTKYVLRTHIMSPNLHRNLKRCLDPGFINMKCGTPAQVFSWWDWIKIKHQSHKGMQLSILRTTRVIPEPNTQECFGWIRARQIITFSRKIQNLSYFWEMIDLRDLEDVSEGTEWNLSCCSNPIKEPDGKRYLRPQPGCLGSSPITDSL